MDSWWIKNFRQHNHFSYASGNHVNVGALFDSHPLTCDLFSPPIRFFIGFSMFVKFFIIQLSCTLCWLQNTSMKVIWLEVLLKKFLRLNWIFLIWLCGDLSVFNNVSVLKHLSVWWQTTHVLLTTRVVEHFFYFFHDTTSWKIIFLQFSVRVWCVP